MKFNAVLSNAHGIDRNCQTLGWAGRQAEEMIVFCFSSAHTYENSTENGVVNLIFRPAATVSPSTARLENTGDFALDFLRFLPRI